MTNQNHLNQPLQEENYGILKVGIIAACKDCGGRIEYDYLG